ncbi:MAG: response regulator [Lachnospiraceae bacterium]
MYKVLIIDDVALVRDAVRMLGQWDMFEVSEIYEAGNAQEGLSIIRTQHPDIIITDMKMPVMDGMALLQYMEANHIPGKVIVISGFSDFSYMRTAIKSGVVDYILKPIDAQDLNNAVSAAIEQLEQEHPAKPEPVSNSVVQNIREFIEKHYMEDISLSDLADMFYLSKEHLSRLFKKETGRNLFSYLMDLKLAEARRLLTETDRTLDDIAFSLGFSNGNYFSKVFKKNVGVSPSSYRNQEIIIPDH